MMTARMLLFLLCLGSLCEAQPNIKWSFPTRDASFGQSAAADLDGDGKPEVVFGCYRNDSCLYALHATNGSLLWKFNAAGAAEGCNDAAPLIYDLNGDRQPEVILAASCNPKTFCLNGKTGAVIWTCNTRGSDSPPSVGDLEGDGKLEILHGEFGGYLICIRASDGTRKWELPVDTNSWIQTAPSLVDLDGDLLPDIVVATWNAVNKNDNKVYAFRGYDQKLLWTHRLSDVVYHGTAVGDLDHDGKPELLLGSYNDTLYCLDGQTGSLKWTYSFGPNFAVTAPVVLANLDDSGACEIVFSAWYKMAALRADGSLLWRYDIPGYGSSFRGPAVADISNDRFPDIVFGTSAGDLIGLHGQDGTLIFRRNLRSDYGDSLFSIDHAPLISDFDQDGKLDAFIVGGHAEYPDFYKDFGRAYMLSLGVGKGPDWLMFQKDARRRSSLCMQMDTRVPQPEIPQPTLLLVRDAQRADCFAEIHSPTGSAAALRLFNMWGQVLWEQSGLYLHPGTQRIPLPTAGLRPGMYLCRLSGPGFSETQKFSLP